MRYTFFRNSGAVSFSLLMFSSLFTGCLAKVGPEPVTPSNNETVVTNTPVLAWVPVECDWQEVWINGVMMDSLGAKVNTYVPFALSFGENEWQIMAMKGENRTEGKKTAFIVDDQPLIKLPENSQLLRYRWSVKSSALVGVGGKKLSSGDVGTDGWHSTSLPATVLTVLVRNGVYPNPYIAKNNMLIPDMNTDFNEKYDLLKYSHIDGENPWKAPYWYVTSFEFERKKENQQVWLNFNELNYRAELWLNGKLLADSSQMVGMERQFRFEVTDLLKTDRENHLAVAVFPVDVPGEPGVPPLEPFGDPGVNMGDGMIGKNYTKWDALGWDWQPAVRDRDMGITEDVFLSFTDEVELQDVYITSDLHLPKADYADMVISANLVNHSSNMKEGNLTGKVIFETDTIKFSIPFVLVGEETKYLELTKKEVKQLRIQDPQLWMPVGYGDPHLYEVNLTAKTSGGDISSVTEHHGVREIASRVEDSRIFTINGQDIFLKGGNWVIDMMLNWTSSRYEEEILLTKNANLNVLRVWGPTGVPPKAFFEAADKNGILIWQDFLNDYWGTFKNTPGYQPEKDLFKTISTGIVKRYRNHPALFMWCGGNEGVNPRESLLVNEVLANFDNRSSRFFLKTSNGDGLHGGGPYHSIRPEEFFTHPKLHGYSSEIGASGVPVIESVRRFIPEIGQDKNLKTYPVDGTWAYHDAANFPGQDSRKFTALDNIIRNDYGGPETTNQEGVESYFAKAQLQNYSAYQAAISAIGIQMWDNSTGMLLWKSNSSWPSLVWQLYDWYEQAHAGYYSAKKAFASFNVQLNRATGEVFVVNATSQSRGEVLISADGYDASMKEVWKIVEGVNVLQSSSINTGIILPEVEDLVFVKLTVTDADGNLLTDNIYWLHPKNDFTSLSEIEAPELKADLLKVDDQPDKYEVNVENKGPSIALLVQMKLIDSRSGHEILPALWSDNFVTLLPGESGSYQVEFPRGLNRGDLELIVEPFNR
ncbi:beta galactosidase jelly roll domain-containing protein [Marinilabilia sp.]|uniref:glycoside hydrolase family 2 protein n=1 Tax=Marinilabilia sp. TaxID=2021252 RepID=UPI0025C1E177|nr:beta galactosidase jelly roll domain-containing protein [Marinilabilia sp.]